MKVGSLLQVKFTYYQTFGMVVYISTDYVEVKWEHSKYTTFYMYNLQLPDANIYTTIFEEE